MARPVRRSVPSAAADATTPAVPGAPGAVAEQVAAVGPSGSSVSAPPAPMTVAVPPRVREAVAKATGSAPATVAVHQGEHVDAMTDEISAQAFTRDGEIHLASDVAMGTPRAEEVLAHELTHVVQQSQAGGAMPSEDSTDGREHEEQAREVQRALSVDASTPEPPVPPDLVHSAAPFIDAASVDSASRAPASGAPAAPPAMSRPAPSPVPAIRASARPAVAAAAAIEMGRGSLGASSSSSAVARVQAPVPAESAAPEPLALRTPPVPAAPAPRSTGSSPAPDGVQRLARDDDGGPTVPAVRGGQDVFDPTAGEDAAPQERAAKWYESGGMLDSMFSSDQSYGDDDEDDDPRAGLERQAESLYPLIRARLRAELVRDRERRGRLAREWR